MGNAPTSAPPELSETFHYDVDYVYEDHEVEDVEFVPWKLNLMAHSPDKRHLFIACDNVIKAYALCPSAEVNRPVFEFVRPAETVHGVEEKAAINNIRCGSLAPGLDVVVSVDEGHGVTIFFVNDRERKPICLRADESTWGVALSPKAGCFAVSANSSNVTLWDLANAVLGRDRFVLRGHEHNIPCVAFNESGSMLASASIDETIRLWSVETGECVAFTTLEEGTWCWGVKWFRKADAFRPSALNARDTLTRANAQWDNESTASSSSSESGGGRRGRDTATQPTNTATDDEDDDTAMAEPDFSEENDRVEGEGGARARSNFSGDENTAEPATQIQQPHAHTHAHGEVSGDVGVGPPAADTPPTTTASAGADDDNGDSQTETNNAHTGYTIEQVATTVTMNTATTEDPAVHTADGSMTDAPAAAAPARRASEFESESESESGSEYEREGVRSGGSTYGSDHVRFNGNGGGGGGGGGVAGIPAPQAEGRARRPSTEASSDTERDTQRNSLNGCFGDGCVGSWGRGYAGDVDTDVPRDPRGAGELGLESDSDDESSLDELLIVTTMEAVHVLDGRTLSVLESVDNLIPLPAVQRGLGGIHRLSFIETIPELSLVIVASQGAGQAAVMNLVKVRNQSGYQLTLEYLLPDEDQLSGAFLVGMTVVPFTSPVPCLSYYQLFLLYSDKTMSCFNIRPLFPGKTAPQAGETLACLRM